MRVELTGRHVDITPVLRRLVSARLAKLERLLNDSAVSAQAVLIADKYRLRTEITLHARGEKFLHGEGSARTWESSLAQAVDKLAQQAKTVKGKWQKRKRRGLRPAAVEVGEPLPAAATPSTEKPRMPRTFRPERQTVRLMSLGDAVRQLEASAAGLIVFRDRERASLSVLYRRANGELSLVEAVE